MRRPLCLLCLTFVAALILCMQFISLPVPDYSVWDGQVKIVEGQVCRKEYRKSADGIISVICLKKVKIPENSPEIPQNQIKGVICYMEGGAEPAMGSYVRAEGKVRCFQSAGNPGEFDSLKYYRIMEQDFKLENAKILAMGGKEHVISEGLYRLRRYFSGNLDACFEEKEASVMKALLLGEKGTLDSKTKTLYQRNGIIHILAISGLHISIIGMGLYRLLSRCGLSYRASAPLSAAIILCYGIMTGMGVSSVRAVIMFALFLTARLAGRTSDMLTAAALSAVLILIRQPGYTGHSGFLFSFGAIAGIGALLPALCAEGKGRNGPVSGRLWKLVAPGIAVMLSTLPVHLFFYFSFPVYSILLNLIVIPLMLFVMYAGLFCMITGGLCPFAAWCVSWIDRFILQFYERCCMICEKAPYSSLVLGQPKKWQIGFYVLLLFVLALFHKKVSGWWKRQWLLLALSLLLFRPADGLRITVMDVGQGDCIHIQSDSGSHYLVDGGSSSQKDTGSFQIIPYLKSQGARRLKAVWITHSDSDHCNGILTLLQEAGREGIQIENLMLPDISPESRDNTYDRLVTLAKEAGTHVSYMSRGQYMADGKLQFYCIHPEKNYDTQEANQYSLVLRLSYGRFSGLLTGDIEGEGEEKMKDYMEKKAKEQGKEKWYKEGGLSFLKVAHHGSGHTTDEELLAMLRPRLSFISCGENNRYGHPHQALLERLENCGSRIYITKDSGALTVWSDGERISVHTFR